MPKTVYRQVGSVRRTPRPRISQSSGSFAGSFDSLLSKLGFASLKLQRSRKRR